MIKLFEALYSYTHTRWPRMSEVIRYGISGAIGALVDFGTYVLLTRSIEYWREHFLAANVVAFIFANITTFILHKHFSFHTTNGELLWQYVKFIIVSLMYIAIVQLLLFVGVRMLGWHDIFAKVVAQAVGTVWNYLANRYWSFRATVH